MKFTDWVDLIGHKKIANYLKVHEATVSNWKHSKRRPELKYIYKMHKRANGKLSYAEMINHFMRCRR